MNDPIDPGDERPPLGAPLELMRRLWILNHEIERVSARMSRTIGITAQQRMVLRIVGRFPGLPAGRLSSLLSVDAATVSTALARLEKRGLLVRERDARDGRRVVVWLTAAGRTLDVPTRGTVEAAIEAGLSTCSSEEIDVAHRVLEVLATALRDQHEIPEARTSEKPTRARVTRTKQRRR